ncbi:TetR/AcrR family transcriptional regulator [Sporolactobacillus shoreae]|uniref:TetR/AcrR family transcriptional regulator n=1 Tax=Sporolactobacillus shoreae TaxID=1465501 RepID=A0A4Z0GI66_9BACL|nr:TetR/AcrR family transcriptional regulator [Sporolactobacillus shoreae]TGA95837.1 TetR/AcrR family transcriptional regulator [Sporolactobacillus shoreae]
MTGRPSSTVNRRTDIISAAIDVFAEIGYYRATTAQVAARAKISQPYVFRFFSTKEALLQEALLVSWTRILDAFRAVIETTGSDQIEEQLIAAYIEIMESYQNEVLLQMQAQTIKEDSIKKVMQQGFLEVQQMVLDAFKKAGLEKPEERTLLFLSRGMLCNISMALSLPELMNE